MLDNVNEIYIVEKNTSINRILLEDKIRVLSFVYKDRVNIKIGVVSEAKL